MKYVCHRLKLATDVSHLENKVSLKQNKIMLEVER